MSLQAIEEHNTFYAIRNQLRRSGKRAALAAGGLAAGYTVYRLIHSRHSEARDRERTHAAWLTARLETLDEVVGFSNEEREWLQGELRSVAKLSSRIGRKLTHADPELRELLEIALDSRLVKLRKAMHAHLKPTTERGYAALREFYEEFRKHYLPHIPDSDALHAFDNVTAMP